MGAKWGTSGIDFDHDLSGWVYFLEGEKLGRVKIGFTVEHPDRRFKAIQAMSPDVLLKRGAINGTFSLERLFHQRYRDLRLHGEWFESHPALTEFMATEIGTWPKEGEKPVLFTHEEARLLTGDWARKSFSDMNADEQYRLMRWVYFKVKV
jgi:hypothetical protein